jgi:hypothetical protein
VDGGAEDPDCSGGLKGHPTAELCAEHQISQAQCCQWRDAFLANAPNAFETSKQTQREERSIRANARLKRLVADQALESKELEEKEFA